MTDPKEPKEKSHKKQKANAPAANAASGAVTDDDSNDVQLMPKDQQEPEDVVVLKHILDSMGVDKYEPRVITQLLEFIHRYTSEVLVDAQEYSSYANKSSIDADDIRLAAMSRLNHNYAQMPSRELMMELAEKRNTIPLPPIPSEYGVRLPPVEHQLTAESIRLYPSHMPQFPINNGATAAAPSQAAPPPSSSLAKGTRNIKVSASPIQIKLATSSSF
ncbi:Aste57867_14710 [Aphanomyces stellatus]|uniref:Aste57867_14710 protein n=1 Tax=Aphanomyces stellatus TaxID=120398 RepID=A0A485L1Y3_9STRA|nr:hypothetical protein As57867_014655 [Aphanomyces stellatus]VFT91528.1 Aste57867_14710 [Aphanomyces stellatus]